MKIYILNVLENKKMLLRFWEIILEAKIGDDPYKKVSVRVLLKHTFTYNFIMEWLHETLPRIFPEQIFEVKCNQLFSFRCSLLIPLKTLENLWFLFSGEWRGNIGCVPSKNLNITKTFSKICPTIFAISQKLTLKRLVST